MSVIGGSACPIVLLESSDDEPNNHPLLTTTTTATTTTIHTAITTPPSSSTLSTSRSLHHPNHHVESKEERKLRKKKERKEKKLKRREEKRKQRQQEKRQQQQEKVSFESVAQQQPLNLQNDVPIKSDPNINEISNGNYRHDGVKSGGMNTSRNVNKSISTSIKPASKSISKMTKAETRRKRKKSSTQISFPHGLFQMINETAKTKPNIICWNHSGIFEINVNSTSFHQLLKQYCLTNKDTSTCSSSSNNNLASWFQQQLEKYGFSYSNEGLVVHKNYPGIPDCWVGIEGVEKVITPTQEPTTPPPVPPVSDIDITRKPAVVSTKTNTTLRQKRYSNSKMRKNEKSTFQEPIQSITIKSDTEEEEEEYSMHQYRAQESTDEEEEKPPATARNSKRESSILRKCMSKPRMKDETNSSSMQDRWDTSTDDEEEEEYYKATSSTNAAATKITTSNHRKRTLKKLALPPPKTKKEKEQRQAREKLKRDVIRDRKRKREQDQFLQEQEQRRIEQERNKVDTDEEVGYREPTPDGEGIILHTRKFDKDGNIAAPGKGVPYHKVRPSLKKKMLEKREKERQQRREQLLKKGSAKQPITCLDLQGSCTFVSAPTPKDNVKLEHSYHDTTDSSTSSSSCAYERIINKKPTLPKPKAKVEDSDDDIIFVGSRNPDGDKQILSKNVAHQTPKSSVDSSDDDSNDEIINISKVVSKNKISAMAATASHQNTPSFQSTTTTTTSYQFSPPASLASPVGMAVSSSSSSSGGASNSEEDPHNAPFYTLDQFLDMWYYAESDMGAKTDAIEKSIFVREGNNAKGQRGQTLCMYGRIKPQALDTIFTMLDLNESDVFIDIGHGIGNAPMQAAYTRGCESRGIEIVRNRCTAANEFNSRLARKREMDLEQLLDPSEDKRHVGKVDLREGNFCLKEHEEFISSCTKILVNNAQQIFSSRSAVKGKPSLDEYVASLFARTKPGTKMVTLEKLTCMGRSVTEENEHRCPDAGSRRKNLNYSYHASFFEYEDFQLPATSVTWSDTKPITVYVYHRIGDGDSKFVCCNPGCEGNGSDAGIYTSAVKENDPEDECISQLADCCAYCNSKRMASMRQRSANPRYKDY